MPHDSPLPGGYAPGSVDVKRLEDELKSINKRKKAKMVIPDEEELVLEDPSKQGRMEETEYADVEEENAGVEYDFDSTEQQVTPLKALQVFGLVLSEDIQDTDEEQTKALEQQEQERANLKAALKLQKTVDPIEKKDLIILIRNKICSKAFQEQLTEETKECSEEDLKTLLEIVPVEEFRVEALQTKYPINFDWNTSLKTQENIGRLSVLVTLQAISKALKIA
ncbi:hypothetical protein Tco_0841261 [Tanacetum coccineum]|uniref:Uncharacterized protein n=1 Tax=Tanacetum coccineum TaxID=301880 RepID=A0ABQ5AXM7_9ASTR